MKKTLSAASLILAAALFNSASAQIKAVNECYPNVTKSVCGHSSFERSKYINMAGNSTQATATLTPQQQNYLFKDLDVKFGRDLGMVKTEVRYSKNVREDASRKGYVDLQFYKSRTKADDSNLYFFKNLFGTSEGMALHDSPNAYPDFMEKYCLTDKPSHDAFPVNNDAAGEFVANVLKYKYTDFTRPQYYEPINEPHWKYWGEERFAKFHTEIKRHVDKLGLDVKVGGACYSVSNYYANQYNNLNHFTKFIDATENKLDFYSFHTYDYMRWDKDKKEFVGDINSGAPLEGVMDALASYTFNKYGKEMKYVATEHGGYFPGKSYGKTVAGPRQEAFDYYANTYFPGKGFDYEMERRSVDNFLMISSAIANTMVFMNHPHIVEKAVPFILLETSKWDPYYYATLMIKDNFDKTSEKLNISPLIYFYEFFKGVEGDYVHSWCANPDIQHHALRNDKNLVLLYHNVSNSKGEIELKLNDFAGKTKGASIRRVGRFADSHKPYLVEEKLKDLSKFNIEAQESIAVFIPIDNDDKTTKLQENVYYASVQGVQVKGSHSFNIDVKDATQLKDAYLRVGINRKSGVSEGIKISLNGTEYKSEKGEAAERHTGKNGYTTTRIIRIPAKEIKDKNTVEVSFADGGNGGVGAVVLRTLK